MSQSRASFQRRRREVEAVFIGKINDMKAKIVSLENEISELEDRADDLTRAHAQAEQKYQDDKTDDNKNQMTEAKQKLEDLTRQLRSVRRLNKTEIKSLERNMELEQRKMLVDVSQVDEDEEQFLGDQDPDRTRENAHPDELEVQAIVPDWLDKSVQPSKSIEDLRKALDATATLADLLQKQSLSGLPGRVGKELPPFGGEYEQWPAWITQYETTTTSCKFSDVENLYRLQKSLKGAARESVQALLTSPNNVPVIVKTLKFQFGRPELIISTLIAKAKEVSPPIYSKPGSVVKFANTVRNLVSTSESFDRKEYLCNPTLLRELLDKLHPFQKKEWGNFTLYKNLTVPSIADFSEWMDHEAEAVMCYITPEDLVQKRDKGRRENMFVSKKVFDKKDTGCWFCGKPGHSIGECEKYENLEVKDKWEWVKKERRCFGCLKKGHMFEKCNTKKNCGVGGCKRQHHITLHSEPAKNEDGEIRRRNEDGSRVDKFQRFQDDDQGPSSPFFCGSSKYNQAVTLLKLAPVIIHGPHGSKDAWVMMDEGATCSLADADITEELGINGVVEPLELTWTNDVKENHTDSQLVSFEIESADGERHLVKNVHTVHNSKLPVQCLDVARMKKQYPHLQGVPVRSQVGVRPVILLGQDQIHLTIAREVRDSHNPDTPVAVRTKLGWVIHGPTGKNAEKKRFAFTIALSKDEELNQLVKESFKIESLGIKIPEKQLMSKADARAEEILESTTRKLEDNSRWETGLLWRHDNVQFFGTREMAEKRLTSVEARMARDAEYKQWYVEKINYYLEVGYCRYATKEELKTEDTREFYLPHFTTCNVNKPKKLRLVFDAAAKSRGRSLNSELLTGPDNLNALPGVLMRFRRGAIAFGADVKEMFHQVKIKREDQVAQRFLWREGDSTKVPSVMVMDSMIFGAACSPCSAQYVMRRNADDWKDKYPEAVHSIKRNMYVDDLADSSDDIIETKNRVAAIDKIQDAGGFPMLKWMSNKPEVLDCIPVDKKAAEMQTLELDAVCSMERILGLFWDPKTDVLTFRFNFPRVKPEIVTGEAVPTKREVLRLTMSLFDPLGIIVNYTVRARILLQDVWRCEIGWDEKLPESLLEKWRKWISELKYICNVKIPRCLSRKKLKTAEKIRLHIFTDASEKAYSCVGYLEIINPDGKEVSFVLGKARVSPLKPQSIPRLELQGAVMGVRMAKYIKEESDVKIDSTKYWTDSRTVLCWLRADARKYKQFVSHRIGEILEATDITEWRWVPTKENPADDATRDEGESGMTSDSRWIKGPQFLLQSEDLWPIEKTVCAQKHEETEMKKEFVNVIIPTGIQPFFDWTRHSTYQKTVRVLAWICRLCENIKKKKLKLSIEKKTYLNAKELAEAEKWAWQFCQKESFPEEYKILKKNEIPKKFLNQLLPYLDKNGVIRMRSRLRNAPIPAEAKSLIILSGKHILSHLIVKDVHVEMGHANQEAVISKTREKFWITGVRAVLKKVESNCALCTLKKAKPSVPLMGDIPESRFAMNKPPFSNCGLDIFGPVYISCGRKTVKKYVALFTCLTIRGVHLEKVDSLSTDSLIMAIRRFMAVRNKPDVIWSDNGTNMKGACEEIGQAFRSLEKEHFQSDVGNLRIEWRFIPPGSPNFGGAWERLVRSVKVALRASLDSMLSRNPKEEIFDTLLMEAMDIVNCRPLTHLSMEPDEEEPLTPNHFMKGFSRVLPPFGTFTDSDIFIRKQWRTVQRLADQGLVGEKNICRPYIQGRSGTSKRSRSELAISYFLRITTFFVDTGHEHEL